MNILDLPDDILEAIVDTWEPRPYDYFGDWPGQAPQLFLRPLLMLGSVCRRWRIRVFPYLFRQIYVIDTARTQPHHLPAFLIAHKTIACVVQSLIFPTTPWIVTLFTPSQAHSYFPHSPGLYSTLPVWYHLPCSRCHVICHFMCQWLGKDCSFMILSSTQVPIASWSGMLCVRQRWSWDAITVSETSSYWVEVTGPLHGILHWLMTTQAETICQTCASQLLRTSMSDRRLQIYYVYSNSGLHPLILRVSILRVTTPRRFRTST